MIHYVRSKDIKYKKWDRCIEQSANGNIYAYSWYLDCVCEHWDALVEGDYDAVMPLPFRRKIGVNYVFPPTMTQQLGIFGRETISENKVQEFIAHIPPRFKYYEINLNHLNPVPDDKHTVTTHTNLELNLNLPYAELLKGFSENTRRNLRKTEQINIRVWKNGDIRNLLQLFKKSKAAEIKTLPGDFYKVVEKAAGQMINRHQAEVWEVSINVDVCAGVLFAFSHNRAYFLFSAATPAAKENNIMHFLINAFIKENAGTDMILDFEGSDNKNLARFYKSFGADEKNYKKIIINRLPGMLFSLAQAIRKK
jgi:hypothetical protein